MARTHSQAARLAGAELSAIAASSESSTERARAALGFARGLRAADLAGAGFDVVHVCTPNQTHAAYARTALAAGSHVICEKPLATSAAEARELVEVAHAAGLTGTVPFVYRYHPMVREARERIRAGEAGAILTVDGSYLQDWLLDAGDVNWRVDAGEGGPSRAFADIGSHLVDLIEFVTGDRISRLAATTRTVHPQRGSAAVSTEDTVAVTFEFAGGGIGTLLVSQVAPGRKNALVIEIAGDRESLRFEQERPEQLWVGRRQGSALVDRDADALAPDAARLCRVPAGHPQGYQDAFNAFVADSYALMRGNQTRGGTPGGTPGDAPDGVPTFVDGLRAAVVTEAVLAAAESGTWVEVPQS